LVEKVLTQTFDPCGTTHDTQGLLQLLTAVTKLSEPTG